MRVGYLYESTFLDNRDKLLTIPPITDIIDIIQLFDRNEITNKIQPPFIVAPAIGSVSWLCRKFNPSTYEEFYHMYLKDGVNAQYDPVQMKGDLYHGRTLLDMWNAANIYKNRICAVNECLKIDEIKCFWDIWGHTIFETMNGAFIERYVADFYSRKYNIFPMFTDPDLDINGGVDIIFACDDKYFYAQVKPVSAFCSNTGNDNLITDRKGFYKKQETFDDYVRKTFGESHVGPTTFILYNGGTIEEPRFVINKNGKPFFKLEELCDKNGLVHTNFSTYPTGTLPEIHKYDLFGHFK